MASKAKATEGKGFFYFPERLNKLALLLITIVYALVLSAIFYLSFSNVAYADEMSYDHVMFDSEMNSMVTVTTAAIPDSSTKKVSMTNSVFLSSYSLIASSLTNVSYAVYGEGSDGTLYYLYQTANSSRTTTTVSHQVTSGKAINGTFTSFFVKTWHNTALQDSSEARKIIESEETVIPLTLKELKKITWGTDKNILVNDLTAATVNLTVTDHTKSSTTDYIKQVTLNIGYGTGVTGQRHIDTQSYILTDSDTLYPLIGVYGLERVASVTAPLSAKIYDIEAVAIYTITKYYASDGTVLTNYLKTDL